MAKNSLAIPRLHPQEIKNALRSKNPLSWIFLLIYRENYCGLMLFMRRLVMFTILILSAPSVFSQLNISAYAGFMNYDGDLQGKSFTLNQSQPAFGLGIGYSFLDRFSVSYNIIAGKVGASDAKSNSQGRISRNLDFSSPITEANILFEASLFRFPDHKITPYGFAGVAAFRMNPYTVDQNNEKIYLQPLNTEGQGLPEFPDRTPYKLTQVAIPFGAGVKYAINDFFTIAAEVSLRKTFTDYIDDVSSRNYVDTSLLAAAYGPQSAALSFRAVEINPSASLASVRGNPNKKDSYYTCLLKLTYNFSQSSIFKY